MAISCSTSSPSSSETAYAMTKKYDPYWSIFGRWCMWRLSSKASSWKPNSRPRVATDSGVGSSRSSHTSVEGSASSSLMRSGSKPVSLRRPSQYSRVVMAMSGEGTPERLGELEQRGQRGFDLGRGAGAGPEPGPDDPIAVDHDDPWLRFEPPRLERRRSTVQGDRRRGEVGTREELLEVDEVRLVRTDLLEGQDVFVHHGATELALAEQRGGEGHGRGLPVLQRVVQRDVVHVVGRGPGADLLQLLLRGRHGRGCGDGPAAHGRGELVRGHGEAGHAGRRLPSVVDHGQGQPVAGRRDARLERVQAGRGLSGE